MNTNNAVSAWQHISAVSRRGSLRVLGGTALAGALAAPVAVSAGKAGKKAKKRCQTQRLQCRNHYEQYCEGQASCEEATFQCCEHLARCDAGAFLACLYVLQ